MTSILIMDEQIWYEKLLQLGIPSNLAERMTPDVAQMPYAPEQFTDLNQLVATMQDEGFQALDWWTDLMAIVQMFIDMIPGILITAIGGAMAYFLRNVKVKGVPLALIGIAPIGIGTWLIVQPFLQPTVPTI